MKHSLSVDQRIADIRQALAKVSPFDNTRLLIHLMPLVEEIERLRARDLKYPRKDSNEISEQSN